eukprot:m51a1_g7842 hypothetical protein (346) ;mRNA; r:204746-205907
MGSSDAADARDPDEGAREHARVLQRMCQFRQVVFADTCHWLHGKLRSPLSTQRAVQRRAWALLRRKRVAAAYNTNAGQYRAWLVRFLCDNVYEGHAAPAIDVHDPPIEGLARDRRVQPATYKRYLAQCRSAAQIEKFPELFHVVRSAPPPPATAQRGRRRARSPPPTSAESEEAAIATPIADDQRKTNEEPRSGNGSGAAAVTQSEPTKHSGEQQQQRVGGAEGEKRGGSDAEPEGPRKNGELEGLVQAHSAALYRARVCESMVTECETEMSLYCGAIARGTALPADTEKEMLAASALLREAIRARAEAVQEAARLEAALLLLRTACGALPLLVQANCASTCEST